MLSKSFILDNKIERYSKGVLPKRGNKTTFIYFLINCENIVYIGQSRNISQRLSQHNADKDFTHYYLLLVDNEKRMEIERQYIKEFKPVLNVQRFKYNNKVICMNTDTGLYEAIKEKASRDNVKISDIVNRAIEDYINNYL